MSSGGGDAKLFARVRLFILSTLLHWYHSGVFPVLLSQYARALHYSEACRRLLGNVNEPGVYTPQLPPLVLTASTG